MFRIYENAIFGGVMKKKKRKLSKPHDPDTCRCSFHRNKRLVESGQTFAGHKVSEYRIGVSPSNVPKRIK